MPSYIYKGIKKTGKKSYTLSINLPGFNLFRLERKKDLVKDREKYFPTKYIDSIEYSRTTECQCIKLDSKDELYITDSFVVTHNTLLSLAVGLHLVMEKNAYSKLVLFRPIIPFGEDIGYLPGEKDDKMHPWLYPIWDNMYELLSNGSKTNGRNQKKVSEQIEELIAQNYLEVGALTYIKGRSLKNSFIIVDEAEDLTPNEIKMIATRVGEGSKVIFTGDITQIDNPKLNVYDCGIAKAIHALADEPSVGHITLPVSERSTLAGLVAKRL
jgi:PhoH-like ATPase